MTSRDGHWRVRVISLDGAQRMRVEHDSPQGMPVHCTGATRCGLVQTGRGWWLAGDFRTPAEVGQWVSLEELEKDSA